jgi:hypothetical protein
MPRGVARLRSEGVHTHEMPLNRPRSFLQRLSCTDTISAPMIALAICRSFWPPVAMLVSATIEISGLRVSGSFGDEDNVGSVYAPASPASTPPSTGINENQRYGRRISGAATGALTASQVTFSVALSSSQLASRSPVNKISPPVLKRGDQFAAN